MSWLHNLKTSVIFCIVLILLIFLSCDIFDSNKIEKLPIEGNILFCVQKTQEHFTSTAYQRIMILIFTEKYYPCIPYTIKTKVSRYGNKITIALLYIIEPTACFDAFGPARTELFFNLAEGNYSLNFFHKGVTDRYEFAVSDSTINIIDIESHFTKQTANCTVLQ